MHVSDNILILSGKAKNESEKQQIEEIVQNTGQLGEIRNELEIKQDSGFAHAVSVIASEMQDMATGEKENLNIKQK